MFPQNNCRQHLIEKTLVNAKYELGLLGTNVYFQHTSDERIPELLMEFPPKNFRNLWSCNRVHGYKEKFITRLLVSNPSTVSHPSTHNQNLRTSSISDHRNHNDTKYGGSHELSAPVQGMTGLSRHY